MYCESASLEHTLPSRPDSPSAPDRLWAFQSTDTTSFCTGNESLFGPTRWARRARRSWWFWI